MKTLNWAELIQLGVTFEEWDAYGTMMHVGDSTVYVDRRNCGYWNEGPIECLVRVNPDGDRQRMTDEDLRVCLTNLVWSIDIDD